MRMISTVMIINEKNEKAKTNPNHHQKYQSQHLVHYINASHYRNQIKISKQNTQMIINNDDKTIEKRYINNKTNRK